MSTSTKIVSSYEWQTDEGHAFAIQNELTMSDLTVEDFPSVDEYATEHSGGLRVLWKTLDGKETPEGRTPDGTVMAKLHDSWGDDGKIVVHVYEPSETLAYFEESETYFESGKEALVYFLGLEEVDGKENAPYTDDDLELVVRQAKTEILADIADGTVEDDVPDFSALHDFTDANTYGGLCDEGDAPEIVRSLWALRKNDEDDQTIFDFANAVQTKVDEWLKAGRPNV